MVVVVTLEKVSPAAIVPGVTVPWLFCGQQQLPPTPPAILTAVTKEHDVATAARTLA